MSEFTKYPLSGQRPDRPIAGTAARFDPSTDEIAFYLHRGRRLHSKAIRTALFAGFCSVGKAADRAGAAIGQIFRKAGHSPS